MHFMQYYVTITLILCVYILLHTEKIGRNKNGNALDNISSIIVICATNLQEVKTILYH